MDTKEKRRHFPVFVAALIICLAVFVCPVHAAELQADDNGNSDSAVFVQEELTAVNTDADSDQTDLLVEESIDTSEEDTDVSENSEMEVSQDDEARTENEETVMSDEITDTDEAIAETEVSEGEEDIVPADNSNTEENGLFLDGAVDPEPEVEEPPMPFARPIKDGTYIIVSKINGFKGLQPEDYLTDEGRQIEVRDCDGSNAQKFKLVSDAATGYYSITNILSGKNLSVQKDVVQEGTPIVQNAASDSLGQKWILVEKDGYYMLQSALDGTPFVLALKNGSTGNGADAILQEAKDAASQLFSFLISKPSVTISDGVYEINSALNNNMKWDIASGSMNNNGNLQLYKSNSSEAQKFIVSKVGNNKYTIVSYRSGKAVDLTSSKKAAKTNVQQYSLADTDAQRWIIRNTGDGTLYISSSVSGLPIALEDGKTANKTNIFVDDALGTMAQKFTFTKVSEANLKPIADGVYLLHSAKNNNRVLGVEDGSRLQRGNIQLQYNTKASFQKFKITYAGKGYYKIQNVKSKHLVDIKDGSYYSAANIQQWHDNGTLAQLWLPHKNSDGSYTFISARSSRVLDAAGGSTADSTNIQTYNFNDSAAQKFKLEKTSGSDSTAINNGTQKEDRVLSAMCKKAQDYGSDTNYLILCNVTNHRLVLFKEIEGRWISVLNSPISVGKASTPTPTGTFYVYNHWEYFDGDYKAPELTYQCWWSTCFYGSYYFHSVLYDIYSGYPGRLRDGRMEVNVSHGCVRMPLENAKYLYDHSPIGTKVRVYK